MSIPSVERHAAETALAEIKHIKQFNNKFLYKSKQNYISLFLHTPSLLAILAQGQRLLALPAGDRFYEGQPVY